MFTFHHTNPIHQFLSSLHSDSRTNRLLTAKEEVFLGNKIQAKNRALEFLANATQIPPNNNNNNNNNSNTQNFDEVIRIGRRASAILVEKNLRLVQKCANVYVRNGLNSGYDFGDLFQTGSIGLHQAAEKFDPKKGFRFTTYAMFWIRASLKTGQLRQKNVIRIPDQLEQINRKAFNEVMNTPHLREHLLGFFVDSTHPAHINRRELKVSGNEMK